MTSDNLINQLSNIAPDDGVSPNSLLSEFFNGRPISELKDALHSENEIVVDHAVWIASELGSMANSLMDDVYPLLKNRSRRIRLGALNVVLSCADESHARHLRTAVNCLEDEDLVVRVSAMFFWARARRDKLSWAVADDKVVEVPINPGLVAPFNWLLSTEAQSVSNISEALRGERRPLWLLICVIAAARLGADGVKLLSKLHRTGDPGIDRFLELWLKDF